MGSGNLSQVLELIQILLNKDLAHLELSGNSSQSTAKQKIWRVNAWVFFRWRDRFCISKVTYRQRLSERS
jgi:hypothetical protein